MPEPIEPQLDELRRRARRRLIGAVVLALAAAVVVPMLLESEPRPLGEDISVRIPPIGDGKFASQAGSPPAAPESLPKSTAAPPADTATGKPAVESAASAGTAPSTPATSTANAANAAAPTGASGPSAMNAPKTSAAASASATSSPSNAPATTNATNTTTTAPRKSLAEAERGVLAPEAKVAAREAQPKTPGPAQDPAKPPVSKAASATSTVASAAAPAASAGTETNKPPAGTPAAAFSVQLGAFIDDKGASALAGRLKKAGHPAYTEPYATSRGTVWRVRVGPFATRDAAEASQSRLKADGQNGIIAADR